MRIRKLTDQEIEEAGNINLIAYAKKIGLELHKSRGSSSYKVLNHGGLYINGDGTKWNWFSRDIGGGPIQFVMEYQNLSWHDAVVHLLDLNLYEYVIEPISKAIVEPIEFVLPKKNDTFKHIIAYLIKTRGIDKDILYDFIEQKKIYENTHKSCVFVGYDEQGEAKFASCRSTGEIIYKGDVGGSSKYYPFCKEGTANVVRVFEAPIDLLSYLTLIKKYEYESFDNHHYISLGGISDKALEYYLAKHPEINTIAMCVDNDEKGDFAYQHVLEKFDQYTVKRHTPKQKDWNEVLLAELEKEKIVVSESTLDYKLEDYTVEAFDKESGKFNMIFASSDFEEITNYIHQNKEGNQLRVKRHDFEIQEEYFVRVPDIEINDEIQIEEDEMEMES